VAVIGGNGSGKSTLIRVLSRTLPPSEGTIEGAGSVVPFGALDGPISTERTGCDNLRMIARLLGLPLARLEESLPEIIEFSELGVLANEKVCRYSSRSFIRLSMAMALCMDADIYLIDDGLRVPDSIYYAKVKAKFAEILNRNRTLVFASNNLHELRQYCRRALLLEGGKLVADGDIELIAERYLAHGQHTPTQTAPQQDTVPTSNPEFGWPRYVPTRADRAYRRELKRAK
jgi:ABC-type polysaccharide/polyol phosphate transport system ATPase subunit